MTLYRAKALCGLPDDFSIRTSSDYDAAISAWKGVTVAARRAGDDHHAATLSQCKEVFKKVHNAKQSKTCPDCGLAKSSHSERCQVCSHRYRTYGHALYTLIMKEYEVESGTTLIPPRTTWSGVLTQTLRKLVAGQVGDHFVTRKHSCVVKAASRNLGLEVICRCMNPEERDKTKRMYGVWRSDGLDMDEVNEIIQKRLKGEEVPPPKPCVPDPDVLAKKHPKKSKKAEKAAGISVPRT